MTFGEENEEYIDIEAIPGLKYVLPLFLLL